mmetsp:Transcript_156883/g.481230  ORF Transcript_156883/g.481230 Transcript_156883/m.481230 type:complete len:199 (-) Transcript_156883:237-833(-)
MSLCSSDGCSRAAGVGVAEGRRRPPPGTGEEAGEAQAAAPERPLAKRARLASNAVGAASCTLQCLLTVRPSGPLDFGGQLAELLWGVHFEYSAPIEYLLLCFRPTEEERKRQIGAKRVERPELHALLRCSRGMRIGTLAAAKARRRTIEPEASPLQREASRELCDALRQRYPVSWAAARGCCGPRAWDEPVDAPVPAA